MWPTRRNLTGGHTHRPARRHLRLLALAALLPIIGLSVFIGATALRDRQDIIEFQAVERVSALAAAVNQELDAQILSLQILATALPLATGGPDRPELVETMERVRLLHPLWFRVLLTDLDGNRLAEAPAVPQAGPGKVVDLESHARVVSTGKPGVGTVMKGPKGRAAFAVRVPVVRDGRMAYVLTAIIEPRAIRTMLLDSGFPPEWIGVIVDHGGKIVARTRGPEDLAGTTASESARRIRETAPEGLYDSVGLDGFPLRAVYRKLPSFGWSIHYGLPADIFTRPVWQAGVLMAAGGAVCLGLAALFAWLFVRELRVRRENDAALEAAQRLEALGQMTRGVAHDFNNLLQSLSSCLTLVEQQNSSERLRGVLSAGHQAVARGSRLTGQLLSFARRQPLQRKPINMHDQLLEMSELMSRTLRPDIRFAMEVGPGLWTVEVDPVQFEITVLNILANARDAMPEAGTVTIRIRNGGGTAAPGLPAAGGEFVALEITDTGKGIPPDMLKRVFEPFYTTKRAIGGTGLGLSQAYGFAVQSGGSIEISSEVGRGTTVTLLLPRSGKLPVTEGGRAAAHRVTPGARILLVEDDVLVGPMLSASLGSLGYDVKRAGSGDEALSLLEAGTNVDLLISDIVMPGEISGVKLLAQVRMRWPGLAVILMSGYSDEAIGGEGVALIRKPFASRDLVDLIETELQGQRCRQSSGTGA